MELDAHLDITPIPHPTVSLARSHRYRISVSTYICKPSQQCANPGTSPSRLIPTLLPVDKRPRRSLFRLRFRCLQVFTSYSQHVLLSIFRPSGQAGPPSSFRRQAIHCFGCPTAGCLERRRSAPGCAKRLGCK